MKKQKAFTLVELLVVIAILAALATVAIISYNSFKKKGNQVADTSLIYQMNTAVKAYDGKLNTVSDARDCLAEKGILLEKIVPSTEGYYYAYLLDKLEFVIVDSNSEESIAEYKSLNSFLFVKKYSDMTGTKFAGYSFYLQKGFDQTEITITSGLDCGEVELSRINYNHEGAHQSVVLCTNGGNLVIYAPNDEIFHYDYADSCVLSKVAMNSYYECGSVPFVSVEQGHIYLKSGCDVDAMHFTDTNTDNAFEEIKVTYDPDVALPDFSRDAVVIDQTNGTLVCELEKKNAEDDFIWLWQDGITEQVKVSASSETCMNDFVFGDNPNLIENTRTAADQIANILNGDVRPTFDPSDSTRALVDMTNPVEFCEGASIDVTYGATDSDDAKAAKATAALSGQTALVDDNGQNAEDVKNGVCLFAGGNGTEKYPWLIVDYDTMQKVSEFYLAEDGMHYFKVKDGITVIDCNQKDQNDQVRAWVSVDLYGTFDGNGVTFINVDKELFHTVYQSSKESSVYACLKNFTVEANITEEASHHAAVARNVGNKFIMENVTVTGTIVANYAASFVDFGPQNISTQLQARCTGDYDHTIDWKFINCYSDAILCSSAAGAGFFNHSCSTGGSVVLTNSKFEGQMIIASEKNTNAYCDFMNPGVVTEDLVAYNRANYYTSMGNSLLITETFTDSTVPASLHYDIKSYSSNPATAVSYVSRNGDTITGGSNTNVVVVRDRVSRSDKASYTKLTLTDGVNTLSVDAVASAKTATASIVVGPNEKGSESGYFEGYYYTEQLVLLNKKFTTVAVKTFKMCSNGWYWNGTAWEHHTEFTETGIYGDYFNVANTGVGNTIGYASIIITEYNSWGSPVASYTYTTTLSTSVGAVDYTNGTYKQYKDESLTLWDQPTCVPFLNDFAITIGNTAITSKDELVVKQGNVVIDESKYSFASGVVTVDGSEVKSGRGQIGVYKAVGVSVNFKGQQASGKAVYKLDAFQFNTEDAQFTAANIGLYNVTITVGGQELTLGSGYTLNAGVISIAKELVTGDIVITVSLK